MKHKILATSITLLLLMSILSIAAPIVPVSASPTSDYEAAITKAADRLVALQSSMDFGWDWVVTGQTAHSGNPSATNLYGVTAFGFLDAHQLTGNTSYFNAAEDLAEFITYGNASKGDFYNGLYHDFGHGASWYWWGYSFDYRYLVRFSEKSGNTTYKDYAVDAWNWVKENRGEYYGDGNQTAMYNHMYSHYGTHGGAIWQSGDFALAALACEDTAWAENMSAVIQSNLTKVDGTDGDRFIGWGKALETFQDVDPATYSTEISTMVGNLSDSQGPAGNFSSGVQDNAYALIGLIAVGETEIAENAADWLVANQGYDTIEGGWKEPNGKEYSEITSEAAQALYAVIQGIGPVGLDHGSDGTIDVRTMTIQQAIDAAYSGDTIIVQEGTYVENVNVNKPVTLKAASRPIIDGGAAGDCISVSANNVVISGFEIRNGYNGIGGQTSGSTFSNNIIHDNLNIPGSAGIGILLWGDNDNNIITGNEIYDNDRQGIFIGYQDDSRISTGNLIEDNVVYNNGLYTYPNGPDASVYGVQLWCADNNIIRNNEIYGHDDWFPYPDTHPTFDFAQGIYLCDSNDNNIVNNYLHDNNYGVGLWHPARTLGNNYINYNDIAGNTGYGVCNYDGIQVDARFNWWGDATGPYHSTTNPSGLGDKITDNVLYSPWFGFPVGTTPMIYHVNPTGKIQDAIDDASPGDMILVYDGTYREALLINKSLTIKAASKPVIEAPATRNTYTFSESTATWDPIVFAFGGTLNANTGAVSGSGTINVTMVGFEIDGRNNATASPTRFAAILYRNVNPGLISNNTIHDMYDADGKGDGPETFGILVYGDSNVTIEYNEVRDFSRGGIGVSGDAGAQPDPVGTVKRNTAVGNGLEPTTGWWAENGIQIAWGAGGSIVENNVSDCQVNNPYWASTGILVHYAAPGVNMLDNTVKDCDYGIGVASPSFDFIDGNVITGSTWVGISLGWPVDNCTASNNLVSSNYIGIGVYDGSDNTIENNTIKNNEYGIWIDGDSHNNVITRNDILNNTQEGIHIEPFGGFAPSETVVHYNNIVDGRAGIRLESNVALTSIKGNVIRDFVKAGIVTRGAKDILIEGNTISTTLHDEAPNGIDIGIYTGTNGTIRENEISGCSWKDFTGDYDTSWSGSGILVIESGDSLEITNNTVYDCDVGMDIESDSMNITCNDVHSNIYGFVFWNANPVVHRNNIYDNTMYGVYRTPLGDLTGTLDAEYNWWGDSSGPYHNVTNTGGLGDRVSDGVDYDPWLDGPIPGDVAIISITPSRNMTCEGQKLDIYVTVKNEGNLTITFDITLYYDNIAIGTQTVTDLAPGANTTLTFSWDTTGITPCINYTISAEASTLPCEVETANNILTDGKVKINIFGDITGDGKVDMKDVATAARAFGSYPGHPRWDPKCDVNNDGKVDMRDIAMIARNFGKTHP